MESDECWHLLWWFCRYLFGKRADDTVLLMLLIRVMDLVVNYGTYSNFVLK